MALGLRTLDISKIDAKRCSGQHLFYLTNLALLISLIGLETKSFQNLVASKQKTFSEMFVGVDRRLFPSRIGSMSNIYLYKIRDTELRLKVSIRSRNHSHFTSSLPYSFRQHKPAGQPRCSLLGG